MERHLENCAKSMVALASVLLMTSLAWGNFEWTGGSASETKYWDDAQNWSGSTEPHRVHYSTARGAPTEIVFRAAEVLDAALWIENSLAGLVTFKSDSPDYGLSQPNNYNLNVGTGTHGALAVDGGRYHFANDILLGIGTWQNNARGDFTLVSGRVETEYWMVLGTWWDNWHSGITANAYVEGGELIVGCRRNGDGVYEVADDALIEMGRAAGSTTTFTQSGGLVSSQSRSEAGLPALIIASGANSTATYTISGGEYVARAGNILIASGEGSIGSLNVDGGNVRTEALTKGAGVATVTLNGGTLTPTADGTFVGSGVAFVVGDGGGVLHLDGKSVTIDGDIVGTGSLTISGYGSLTVNGNVQLPSGTLAFAPNPYYSSAPGENYELSLSAWSIDVAALDGVATVSAPGGVASAGGSFYGKLTGAGGLTVKGEVTFCGLSDFTGGLGIGKDGLLRAVSSLDGISPLWRIDASDQASLSEVGGKVVGWTSQTGNGYFGNDASTMWVSRDYFGGMPSVVTDGSALTSSWSNDGSAYKTYHTQALIGALRVLNHSNAYELLLKYDNAKNNYIGKRATQSSWDRWTKMTGSSQNSDDGFWQNGLYHDLAFHDDERILSVIGFGRNSSATSIKIGGGCGSVAIGEIVALNFDPSHAQRRQIEAYLANKWGVTAMGKTVPQVPLTMSAGAILDLGGLDVTVASFTGAGTVRNGTLRTADGIVRQSGGKLSIPAVEGATYVASSSNDRLEITDAAGKTVTVRIPANWLDPSSRTYSYILCDGNVNFVFEGDVLEYTRLDNGRYRFGFVEEEFDFGEYSDNTTDDADEDEYADEAGAAFPGAFGWGRFAVGARASSAPTVYHVTNLNDSGAGSLRDAVSRPNRIVVFDVSGVIRISSRVIFSQNLYVAGQTAPGEGITVYGNGCSFSGASNIICRYLRWRMGHGGTSGKDCAGIANGRNMIFDHCSFSWGLDETFSINPDGKGSGPDNITLQNCIFGQGLMTHSAGGLMQGDRITLYRNLYVDNSTRNNKVKGINQYANNIVYNWKNGCYIMGGDSSGSSYCTIEGNLFINGPVSSDSNAFGGGNADFHFYGNDNWQDKNRNGILDASEVTHNGGGNRVAAKEDLGVDFPALALYKGNELLDRNLRKVGASLPYRDRSDCYMIDEVRTIGRSGGLITYENTLAIGAPDTWDWWAGAKRADTDYDGIPDDWEDAHGLDRNNSADAVAKSANGRLNIENYINSITAADSQPFMRAPVTLAASSTSTHKITLSWRDYTYGERGFSVEMLANGAWTQVGIAGPNATSYTVGMLTPGTYYDFRVIAVGERNGAAVYSEPAYLHANTREEETGEVDIDSYLDSGDTPVNILAANQAYWDTTHRAWNPARIYANGEKVLLNTDGVQTLNIQEANVAPESIVANGTGYLTLRKVYNLTGKMSLNKGNTGTLALLGAGSYTGKVVNHGGTIEFDSIANGGVASSLGMSTADALNWVFDGGTYMYTGGNASSGRSATFRKTSVLGVANSGTTLTMTGALEGTGDFIFDGAGTLAIPDANRFFGNNVRTATIRGGTLYLSTTGDAGSARNFANKNTVTGITLAGGHVRFASANEEYQTYNVPIYAEDGTSSEMSLATHCYMKSRLTGNGDIKFNIPYVRSLISCNMDGFTGAITANGTASGATFYHSSFWNYPKTRFNLTGTISMASKDRHVTCHLGGLSGTSGTTLSGSDTKEAGSGTTWYVGYANSDEEFAGGIDDYNADRNKKGTTSVVKVGTGYWRLTGTSSHSGHTTVNGGSLIVNGTLPASSAVYVNDGGTLQGHSGNINGFVTVAAGGTLRAGDTIKATDTSVDNDAQLYLKGGVKLESGSKVVIPVARTASGDLVRSRLRPTSSFTIESDVTLEFDLSEVDALKEGESISVFALLPSWTGAFDKIEPASPGRGLKWDVSRLYEGRYIKIVKDPDYTPDMAPANKDTTATVKAVSEYDAYNALDIAVPNSNSLSLDPETYKSYFNYGYKDNGDGTFDVAILGIKDEIRRKSLDSAVDALMNQLPDSNGCIGIEVVPGLYYGIGSGTEPNIAAPARFLNGNNDTWLVPKPSGERGFIRIDMSPFAE